MGGRRTTKQELSQLETMTKEGLTTEASIRNLRYKKTLVTRAEDETKVLFQQRDQLSNTVKTLQGQKTLLTYEVDNLKREKEKLESIINLGKFLLQQTLSNALVNLKQQRPDLFTLSFPEQLALLLKAFLK